MSRVTIGTGIPDAFASFSSIQEGDLKILFTETTEGGGKYATLLYGLYRGDSKIGSLTLVIDAEDIDPVTGAGKSVSIRYISIQKKEQGSGLGKQFYALLIQKFVIEEEYYIWIPQPAANIENNPEPRSENANYATERLYIGVPVEQFGLKVFANRGYQIPPLSRQGSWARCQELRPPEKVMPDSSSVIRFWPPNPIPSAESAPIPPPSRCCAIS